jgi:hypothetical protein
VATAVVVGSVAIGYGSFLWYRSKMVTALMHNLSTVPASELRSRTYAQTIDMRTVRSLGINARRVLVMREGLGNVKLGILFWHRRSIDSALRKMYPSLWKQD